MVRRRETRSCPPIWTNSKWGHLIQGCIVKSILLHIEDNEDDRLILHEHLARPGSNFRIEGAASISAAVNCLRQHPVDLILADLSLPDSSGVETFSRLQDEAPNVPIVLLTGHDDEALASQLLAKGAQDYLDKDHLNRDTLLRALRYAVERKRSEISLRIALEEQQQAHQKIQKAEERFRLVVEATPNAIVMMSTDRNIALVNTQTQNLFGYKRQELLGQPAEILVPERFRSGPTRLFDLHILQEFGNSRDCFGLRRDGSEVPIEIGLNPIDTPDGIFLLASIIDITERKSAEINLRRSLNEKQALLQEVHHRVKNNLQIISSLLTLQANSVQDKQAAAKLLESEQRVRSMSMIHERLYHHNDMSSIDLAEYVRDLASRLVSSHGSSKSVTCQLDLCPTPLAIDQSIPCGMILNELITNALKYAYPEGVGEIKVRLSSKGDDIQMSVSDFGAGLPEHFNWQSSQTLGLTLVRVLTSQIDGTLDVKSHPGASFTVNFNRNLLHKAASDSRTVSVLGE
jgi:two-component system, sensor histidine kinase PdtaS